MVVQPGCRPDHVNARIPQAILRDVQLTNASLAPANLTRRRCRAHSLEARHIRVSMHRPLLASAAAHLVLWLLASWIIDKQAAVKSEEFVS